MGEKANPKAPPRKAPVSVPATTDDLEELEEDSPLLPAQSGGGPGSSILNWLGVGILIRLFRLSVKFVPIVFAMIAAIYGYTYFFGSIPVLESIKNQLGFSKVLPTPESSRVDKMLQQTRDAIASSDSRVHLGNAIAGGELDTAVAIESGQRVITPPEPKPAVQTQVQTRESRTDSLVSDALGSLVSAFEEATSSKNHAIATSTTPLDRVLPTNSGSGWRLFKSDG